MRVKELLFNPVCLSPRLLGIGVAHRSPVRVVTSIRRDTSFHHFPSFLFPTARPVYLLGEPSSSHPIPLPLISISSRSLLVWDFPLVRSRFLTRFLATVHVWAISCAPFLLDHPPRLIRRRRYRSRHPCPISCRLRFKCSCIPPLRYKYDFAPLVVAQNFSYHPGSIVLSRDLVSQGYVSEECTGFAKGLIAFILTIDGAFFGAVHRRSCLEPSWFYS